METTVGLYLVAAVQVDLGVLFLVAGLTKLLAPGQFIRAVAEYRVLPRTAPVVGPVLIASEGFVGVALVSGWMLTLASVVALAWLAVFGLATGINLWRGRSFPCHCFGESSELIGGRTLARIVLVGLSVVLVLAVQLTTQVPTLVSLGPTELVATAGLALFFALAAAWLLRAGELAALLRGAGTAGRGEVIR